MVSQTEHVDTPPWLEDHFIGGHPALDFINTNSHRLNAAESIDRMNNSTKINSWLLYQQLLTNDQSSQLKEQCASEQVEMQWVNLIAQLRTDAGKLFDALAANRELPGEPLAAILKLASDKQVVINPASGTGQQPFNIIITGINYKSVTALIALLILDALFRLPQNRVHACPRCGWLFYDRSKGGRRKWCDMKACGNREKVSRHYHLKKSNKTDVKNIEFTVDD